MGDFHAVRAGTVRACLSLFACAGCNVLAGIDGYVDQSVVVARSGAGGGEATSSSSKGGSGGGGGGASLCGGTLEGACKLVFVTQAAFEANFGGLAKADELCAVESPASIAWPSDGSKDALGRIPDAAAGYCLSDGTRVAECKAELASGKLHAAITKSAKGAPVNEAWVWTGTVQGGTHADKGTCQDWKSASDGEALTGFNESTNRAWTDDVRQPCQATMAHLYCFHP